MTDNIVKDRYEETYNGLKETFRGRGLGGFWLSVAAEQERAYLKTSLENPSAYVYGETMSRDLSDRYRTGTDSYGRRVMTVDDYARLRADEKERRKAGTRYGAVMAELSREQSRARISVDLRPAHPYQIYSARGIREERPVGEDDYSEIRGRRETVYSAGRLLPAGQSEDGVVYSGSGDTEMYVRPAGKEPFLRRIRRQMFRKDIVEPTKGRTGRPNGLVAALAIAAVFMFVLAVPVTLSVLKHIEATRLSRLESEIRHREAEIAELSMELEAKNDLFTIEKLAREKYGMVELDKSVYTMIRINPDDAVEQSEEKAGEGFVPALFSALGIRGN